MKSVHMERNSKHLEQRSTQQDVKQGIKQQNLNPRTSGQSKICIEMERERS